MSDETPEHDIPSDHGSRLDINPEALNTLLTKCQNEGRDPTDEEIVEIMGVQGMMALGAVFEGDLANKSRFNTWYTMVIQPIGLDEERAYALFSGEIDIDAYVDGLTDDEADRFVTMMPDLQATYMALVGSAE